MWGEQGPRQGPTETDRGPGSVTAAGSILSQSRGDTQAPSLTLQLGCVFTLCLKTAGVRDQGVARMRTLGPLIESALSPLAGGRRPAAHPAVRDAAGAWGHPDPVRGRPPTRQGPSQSHRSALVPVTRTVHTHPSLGSAREGARTRSAQVHPSASSSGRVPR